MTRYLLRLKASSTAANTIIAIPQVEIHIEAWLNVGVRSREGDAVSDEQRT